MIVVKMLKLGRTMKRVRVFGAACLMVAMSSVVLAEDGPPSDPGGMCAIVVDLPIPESVKFTLQVLLGCLCFPPDPCGGGGGD